MLHQYQDLGEEETKAVNAIIKMNESYKEQIKALQRAAGITVTEEVTVSSSGVEAQEMEPPMEEKAQLVYGYDQIMNAINSVKSAEENINALVGDQKFNEKHKQKFQVYSQQLNNIQAALNNVASSGAKPKEKILKP